MKKVKIKIIRDDKREFLIDNTVWGIPSDGLIGFDALEVENFASNVINGDGSKVSGSRVVARDRTVKARLLKTKNGADMRSEAILFFVPKKRYKIYITYRGTTRWCEGIYSAFSCPTGNIYRPVEFVFTILCSMPYLFSESDHRKNIAEAIPLAGFPYMSTKKQGSGVSAYKYSDRVVLVNNGVVKTPMKIKITARDTVVNPQIEKTYKTSPFDEEVWLFKINDTLIAGDVYDIDLTARPPKVLKNGINASKFVSRLSNVREMDLDVGGNNISYSAHDGFRNMKVEISYFERFTGI